MLWLREVRCQAGSSDEDASDADLQVAAVALGHVVPQLLRLQRHEVCHHGGLCRRILNSAAVTIGGATGGRRSRNAPRGRVGGAGVAQQLLDAGDDGHELELEVRAVQLRKRLHLRQQKEEDWLATERTQTSSSAR